MLDNDRPSGSHRVDRDAAALMEDEAGPGGSIPGSRHLPKATCFRQENMCLIWFSRNMLNRESECCKCEIRV